MYSLEKIYDCIARALNCDKRAIKNALLTHNKAVVVLDMKFFKQQDMLLIESDCIRALGALGLEQTQIIFSADNSLKNEVKEKISIPGIKNIVLVASGKGGVGKSTIAAALAIALAKSDLKIGLLDADIYGPSIPFLFEIEQKPNLSQDNKIIPVRKFGVSVVSIGFFIESGQSVIWRGPMLHKALHQMIHGVDWSLSENDLDLLIIDTPPGTGDIQLSLASQYRIDGVIFVSTPHILALQDTIRSINMFQKLEVPILGMIQNMSYIKSTNGEKCYVFGENTVSHYCKKSEIQLLADIPLLPQIVSCHVLYEDSAKLKQVADDLCINNIKKFLKK